MTSRIEGFATGLQLAFDGTVCDWLEGHAKLPHSARSVDFDRGMARFLNDILDACGDLNTRQIVVVAPTGGGKTTLLELLIPFVIAQAPGPMLIAGQTDETAKEWVESRLMPELEAIEAVRTLFPKDRHAKRKTEIFFPHMPLFVGGANWTNLQEKSIRYCYGDECWRWRRGMIGELKKRHHDRWNRLTILVSQGSDEDDDFHDEFLAGDQREYGFTCPACSAWQPYKWSSVKYDEAKLPSGEWDWGTIARSVRYECADCAKAFPNTDANRRLLSDAGGYRPGNANAIEGNLSFRYPAMAVWWISWADLVLEWIKAQDAKRAGDILPLKQFIQKRLAGFWKDEEEAPHARLVGSDYSVLDYADGQPWDGEFYRFLTVDKQRDHFWAVIRAWKADGSSRALWAGKLLTFESIRELQLRLKVKDTFTFVDAQYDTPLVYEQCAKFGWTALHGSGEAGFKHYPKKKGRPETRLYSTVHEARLGLGAACRYIFWANEGVKDKLSQLRSGLGHAWEVAHDIGDDYFAQIDSEVKREVVNKTTKAVSVRWVRIRPNHLWDCEAMQVAVAYMMRVLGGIDAALIA